jgi:predicted phage tail protein
VVNDADFKLFSEANVLQEESDGEVSSPCFRYEGTARPARQTAVQVSYNDERDFYTEKKVLVEDREAIARYGYRLAEIRAFGATTIEQAERAGRHFLASNLSNGETVSFSLASEGALLLPGDPILIADPLKHGSRLGGRIVSASASSIVIDGDLPAGLTNYDLWTYGTTGVAQRLPIASIAGRTITATQPFPLLPTTQQNWLISRGRSDSMFRAYKVQSVKEGSNNSYEVVAIRYDEAKYAYVNNGQGSPASAQRAATRRHDTDNLAVMAGDISFTIKAQ